MFNKDDKRRLYQLMDLYLEKKITASVFCSEFYYSFDLEIELDILSFEEKSAFLEVSSVASRFTPLKEDLENYPRVYFNEEELKQIIIKTKEYLKEQNPL